MSHHKDHSHEYHHSHKDQNCHHHANEKSYEHSHSHYHDDKKSHDHSHHHHDVHHHHHHKDHNHNHHHSHEEEKSSNTHSSIGEISLEQKFSLLLKNWIDHNNSHKESYISWAKKAESDNSNENNLLEAAKFLRQAIELSQRITENLESALKSIR